MNATETCVVALRLVAVWFLVTSAMIFWQGTAASYNHSWTYLGYLAYSAAMVCIGGIVYRFAPFIAKALLRDAPVAPQRPTTPEEWLAVGCSLLGIWFAAKAVPSLAENLYMIATTPSAHNAQGIIDVTTADMHLRYYGFQLLVGVLLVLGRKGISRIVAKARGR